ncbi:MAG: serine hydrolase [Coriobacteriales bacterium]|nr:serine hydrolase [Coriobacteriales bacterium]
MRKRIARSTLCFVVVCSLFLSGTPVYAAQEATLQTSENSAEQTPENGAPQTPSGWVTEGKYSYYYYKGQKLTGWQEIAKKKYYFNKNGQMQTNKMISKNKYVNKKGVLIDKKDIFKHGKKGLKPLEKKLKKMTAQYGGTQAIYVKNLDTNEYLIINNNQIYPASVIKVFNMGCAYEQMEKKKFKKTTQVKSWLNSMITVSSNDSYNYLLQKIGDGNVLKGTNRLNAFCQKHGYTKTTGHGTLHPSHFSPQFNGYSYTTAQDCGHIMEDIWRGTLVSEAASKEMLNILKKQTFRYSIPAGLPKGIKSANKTGAIPGIDHDAAIVFGKKTNYVIVVLTKDDGAAIAHTKSISKAVYKYLN